MRVILTGLARCYRRDTPILVATLSTRDTPIHAGHTRIAAQSCRNFGLESVDAYRQLWDRWVRDDGFRVTGYVSSAVRVQVLGDAR